MIQWTQERGNHHVGRLFNQYKRSQQPASEQMIIVFDRLTCQIKGHYIYLEHFLKINTNLHLFLKIVGMYNEYLFRKNSFNLLSRTFHYCEVFQAPENILM